MAVDKKNLIGIGFILLVVILVFGGIYYIKGSHKSSNTDKKTQAYHEDSSGLEGAFLIQFPNSKRSATVSTSAFPDWLNSFINFNMRNSKISKSELVLYDDGRVGYLVELQTTTDLLKNFSAYLKIPGFVATSNKFYIKKSFVIEFDGNKQEIRMVQDQSGLVTIKTIEKLVQ